ncbi:MAG: hypothetical protein ACI4KM_03680 [Oscillospiraceae bacterium]
MTIREAVSKFGDEISAYYSNGEGCRFYPCSAEDAALSANSAESRGILFRGEDMVLCFGEPMIVRYDDISQVTVIPCYESPFEDELMIEYSGGQLRINDCSLHKPLLKQLIDGLILMNASELPELSFGKISWLSDGNEGWDTPEKIEEEIAESPTDGSITQTDEPSDEIMPEAPTAQPVTVPPDDFDSEPDVNLDGLDRNQTMAYLLNSLSEINSDIGDDSESAEGITEIERMAAESALPDPEPPAAEEPDSPYTQEPQSDDLYLKASAKLREICESGKLTAEQIDTAVKTRLVSAAEQYTEITARAEQIPEIIAPRVEELKKASERLDEYFALGEDIASRVMFFMLFQMLSYSDRIAETPQTKEALNDFFRRYGPSGVILSMLDTGI